VSRSGQKWPGPDRQRDTFQKNGWYLYLGDPLVVRYRYRFDGTLETQKIPRVIWDGHFRPPKQAPAGADPDCSIIERRSLAGEGTGIRVWTDGSGTVWTSRSSTSLDNIEQIRHSESWKEEEAAKDDVVKLGIYRELVESGFESHAHHLNVCGTITGVKECVHCDDRMHLDLIMCRQRFLCPTCAREHARKQRIDLEAKIKSMKLVSGYSWKMITLTIKTDGEYRAALKNCTQGFSKIWRMILKRPLAAAHRSIEFAPETGNVHVHVLYYGPYIPQADISLAWQRYTGSFVCDIRQVTDRGNGLQEAIMEVCKYSMKFGAFKPTEIVNLWRQLKGRQMTQRYGQLRGVLTEKQLDRVDMCECGSTQFRYIKGYFDRQFVPLWERDRGPPDV